jgi:hypothetical protein
MTNPAAIYSQFGQALGFAERSLSSRLRAHLAEQGTTPETWYTLQLVATRGPGLSRESAVELVGESRAFTHDLARELLTRLEEEGLIRGGAELDLTAEGEAVHRALRERISARSTELLGQLPVEDVETTVRTLQAVTALAEAEEPRPAA